MLEKGARLVRPYSGRLCQQETPDPLLSKTSISRGYSGFNSLNSKGCTRGSTFRFRGWSHTVQEASMTAEQISRAGSVWNSARQRPSRPLMAREGSGRLSWLFKTAFDDKLSWTGALPSPLFRPIIRLRRRHTAARDRASALARISCRSSVSATAARRVWKTGVGSKRNCSCGQLLYFCMTIPN